MAVGFTDNGFKLLLLGRPQTQYTIQRAASVPPLWVDWAAGAADDGRIEFTDTDPPRAQTYYRAVGPAMPTQDAVRTVTVSPGFAEGAVYLPFRRDEGHQPNEAPPAPVPEGPLRGNLQPSTTATRLELFTGAPPPQQARAQALADPVVFGRSTAYGQNVIPAAIPDMSGAADGSVVFTSGNFFGALSTDEGNTFAALDPTTIFPSTPMTNATGVLIDGGFCCDQIVHYVPQIDRYIWLMQFWPSDLQTLSGQNMLRLASASTTDLINSGGTAWTFWDLRSDVTFRLGNRWFDYPDVSVGDNFLYVSATVYIDAANPALGRLVMRIPLAEIQASSVIHIDYTDPALSAQAVHAHLTQRTGGAIFWAGHVNTSQMRIWTLSEGSNFYSWQDLNVFSWPAAIAASTTPSQVNWLQFPGPAAAPIGATRRYPAGAPSELWFAWTAGAGGGFPHPHVQMVRFDAASLTMLEQVQVWNPDHAYAYPALVTNSREEVGMALGFGGGNFEASSAVGIWGDFVVWTPGFSTSSEDRFGDYLAVRQYTPRTDVFTASVYNRLDLGAGNQFNPIYIRFGRRSTNP